jgi:hypothetical protein
LLLLVVVALSLGTAEYLLTLRPRLFALPNWLNDALRPMWQQPELVLCAIACFAVGGAIFGQVARQNGSATERWQPLRVIRNASGPPRIAVLVGLGSGLLLWGWCIVRVAIAPLDDLAPAVFAASLLVLLGSLTFHEWVRLRPLSWRPSRAFLFEALLVLALVSILGYLLTFDLSDWYYSSIGDEHAFFLFARELALGLNGRSLFAQDGAYGIIPVLNGFLEGLQMRIFGITGPGWKLSTITPVLVGLVATYLLARTLFNTRVALIALALLATSQYLLAYGHSGYPNLEPLLPGVLALLLFVLGIRKSSVALLTAAGMVAGFGWYTYYTGRMTVAMLGVATLVAVRPRSWPATLAPMALGFGLTVLPLFAVSKLDVLSKMFDQTGSGSTTEIVANHALLPWWNLGRTLLAFNYNTHDGPWLSGSLVDPLSGALFILGLALVAIEWRDTRGQMLLAWLGVGLLGAGVFSKYDYVSVSRLNFVLPLIGILCGLAAERLVQVLEHQGPRSMQRFVFPVILAICTIGAGWGNLQRWFVDTPLSVPTTPTSVAMRIIEDPRCQGAADAPLIVDAGIGGAILPALDAAGVAVQPEFGLYADVPTWLNTAVTRCVIFRSPRDHAAQGLARALVAQWPSSLAVPECDRSGRVELLAFYPADGDEPDRPSLGCRLRQS